MLFAALLLWAPRNQNLPSQRTGGDPSGGDSRPTTLEETLLFPRQSTPVPASASGTRGSSEPHPTQLSSQSGSAFPGLNTPETTMQDTCPVHGPPALHPFEFWL
ncbi:uncharacterized protein [Periplaneta americana]|uniref:uncharacterized protein n=1 Tax=Periplaneta americana TaxID=6978 RepID=UPI0037E7936C